MNTDREASQQREKKGSGKQYAVQNGNPCAVFLYIEKQVESTAGRRATPCDSKGSNR